MNYSKSVDSKLKTAKEKYKYYDDNFSIANLSPVKIPLVAPRLGWPSRAVDIRANKTNFDTFENDTMGFNDLFKRYHVGEALNKIRSDILIAGCGFLAVDGDRVMPFTALEATGNYNWDEQNISDGLAVYKSCTKKGPLDGLNFPDSYISYSKDETVIHTRNNSSETVEVIPNPTGRPLMVVLTHQSSARRPFGHSVLKRSARLAVLNAARTYKEMTISAHFYNKKVNVILGADADSTVNKVEMKDGDALVIGPNENGQIPQIAEFAQHALAPFKDTIDQYKEAFCSATKLTKANLGDSGNAPQSPEQQRILSDDLVDDIKAWHDEIGAQLKYLMTTLYMLEHGISEIDDNLQSKIDAIKPVWMPMFITDLSKGGDAIQKLKDVAPGALRSRTIWRNLGLTSAEIDEVIASLDSNTIV